MPARPLLTDPPPAAADDADLLRHIAAGDRSALAQLYRAQRRPLARFLARFTRRQELVDEVLNDTFWIVWQKAGDFRGESRVSTWIMGIAYRCTLKALRDAGPPHEPLDAGPDEPAGPDADARRELADWLGKGLSRLPIEQRMTMELAYVLGHSLEEIAMIMDCPQTTVKARMFHARIKLRNLLPALAQPGEASPRGPHA